MEEKYEAAQEKLKKYGQEHLLKGYEKLTQDKKDKLLDQILTIDFSQIEGLYKEINKKLDEMAEILDRDYEGKAITVLSVLNGAVFFTTDLTSRMKTKMQFAFIKVSSYEGTESTGKIKLKADVDDSLIEGKDVLIVEDIVDTGRTMSYLLEHLKAKNPKSLKLCSLISKPSRREIKVPIDYLGFEIPNKFIIGYGFDDEEGYRRNLPYIGYKEV